MFMHNSMFDSSASHNLMPTIVMDGLGLDITKPYKDIYSFDSREVKCLGLIKDLVVSLHQILEKNLVMNMVVVNVPPKFGMLLSRSWAAMLKGTIQMDLSYAIILVFGTLRRLYRENRLAYMINNKENSENHPSTLLILTWAPPCFLTRLDLKRTSPSLQIVEAANQTTRVPKQTWIVSLMMRP